MSSSEAALVHDLAPAGVLRASINLGNPVLAQGTADDPRGVTVDLAREVARRLGVELRTWSFDAARHSFEALAQGRADLAFLAVEPAREAQVAFTEPYVVIEGVYAVPADSPLTRTGDVDREGVRIGVKEGSAYDLYLTRTLQHAQVVRGPEGTEVFERDGLEVAAGIRQPLTAYVTERPGLRLLDERFMQIRQAVATGRDRAPATLAWLRDVVEELKTSGFVAEALQRSGQSDATVAPPATER